ncbi:MAG: hypothetical protein AB7O28_17125 [Vicinamibacterales bacterium]
MSELPEMGTFAFVVVSALRAKQLARGCVPRVAARSNTARTSQAEVAAGMVSAVESTSAADAPPAYARQDDGAK